jgi:hypothetical protein
LELEPTPILEIWLVPTGQESLQPPDVVKDS